MRKINLNAMIESEYPPQDTKVLWVQTNGAERKVISIKKFVNGDWVDVLLEAQEPSALELVDLGLPSGTKWAVHNVGATLPEGYGDYYAWGETEKKDQYDWSNYKYCNGTSDVMTKYVTDSSKGTVDNKSILEAEDDIATVMYGSNYRMPTTEEWLELITNCTWVLVGVNDISCWKITSTNGNSILLPLGGYYDGGRKTNDGAGCYWSSSLDTSFNSDALSLESDYHEVFQGDKFCNRYKGLLVRAVSNS